MMPDHRSGSFRLPVEALDVRVLRRLAARDEVELDVALVGPGVDDGARELAAVVDADRLGLRVQLEEPLEDADDARTWERVVDLDDQACA